MLDNCYYPNIPPRLAAPGLQSGAAVAVVGHLVVVAAVVVVVEPPHKGAVLFEAVAVLAA